MPRRTPPLIIVGSVFCLLVLSGCSPLPSEGGDVSGEPQEKEATVDLVMSAGPIGKRLLVNNHSDQPWENILMVINENRDGGGYRLKLSRFAAQASLHFGLRAFRNSENERFKPSQQRVATLTVYADTPQGRGRWHTAYPKK